MIDGNPLGFVAPGKPIHPARKSENQKEEDETTALTARQARCLTETKMSQVS